MDNNTLKLFIIDNSAVIRGALGRYFNDHPRIEVVGRAACSPLVLKTLQNHPCNVILGDPSEDPHLFEHLKHHNVKLMLWASPTAPTPGFRLTLHKPNGTRDIADACKGLEEALLNPQELSNTRRLQPIRLVVIGSSTGGPKALEVLLTGLPGDFPVPILITQHMPANFTAQLARSLNNRTQLHVHEAHDGERIYPGGVWIAPGNFHMQVHSTPKGMTVALDQGPPVQSCRPSVDVLFESAALCCGRACLGVVLTGMGYDGRDGGAVIQRYGGELIAQDEASSVVWGMPGALVKAGLANSVLPLTAIAGALMQKTTSRRSNPSLHTSGLRSHNAQ